MGTKTGRADGDRYDAEESERRYRATLANVLATPPDHKMKVKPGASPKKRGRPPKAKERFTIEMIEKRVDYQLTPEGASPVLRNDVASVHILQPHWVQITAEAGRLLLGHPKSRPYSQQELPRGPHPASAIE